MALEEQLLAQMINKTFDDARSAVNQLIDKIQSGDDSPETGDAGELVSYYIGKAFNEVAVLAERMNLALYSTDIRRIRATIIDLSDLSYAHEAADFYSKPLMRAQQLFDPLEVMQSGRALTGLSVFEHVLKSTTNILSTLSVTPKSEANVRDAVRSVLECCFHDVRREIPLSKNLKVYQPDLGIVSLKAAAEYKIVKSKASAKNKLDELYADMKGYTGDHNWQVFYAVIYMNKQYFTQDQVEKEFKLVGADASWTPIVVVGPIG